MKKKIRAVLAAALAVAVCATSALALEYPETVAPGDTIGFGKGDFYDKRDTGDVIPGEVEFNNQNFSIYKKTVKTGANLIEDIKINSRAEEVQIVFNEKAVNASPNRANVVISELSVRASRSFRSDGETIMKSGTVYTIGEPINIRVGLESEEIEMSRDGVDISLESGEKRYVRWVKGDGDGRVYVSYGNIATAEGRVYNGNRCLYYFNDEVDYELEDANPDAYISALDLGTGEFEGAMKLQILASRSDHVYEYNNGRLTAAQNLKWNTDQDAWTTSLTKGRHYIISDIKLRGISGTTGGSTSDNSGWDDGYDDESSSTPVYDNPYFNPSTGGGSNLAVSISAIVAIVAIAALSIIMSTILAVKKKQ